MKKNMMALLLVVLITVFVENINVDASQLNIKEAENLKTFDSILAFYPIMLGYNEIFSDCILVFAFES